MEGEVPEEVRKYVEESRRRREKLKLEILASLSVVKKAEEGVSMAKARRNTLDVTMMAVMDVGREMEVDVRGMSKRDGLKLRFLHTLASKKEEEEMKVMQKEEIEKMREVQEKVRKEKKRLEESLRQVKAKNRRLAKYLQIIQTRLVSSVLALNYQMSRKVELTRQVALLAYYRDVSLENSLAYLYGQLPNESTSIPLGGVFSPYAYVDYNEEEERLEKEYTYLTTLCPPSFRASAQQRRVSLRLALIQCFQAAPSSLYGSSSSNKLSSIEYASLDKYSFFGEEDNVTPAAAVPHLISLRSSSSSSISGHGNNNHRNSSDGSEWNVGGALQQSSLPSPSSNDATASSPTSSSSHANSKRSIKSLKPSLSDRPTKHEIEQTSPRKPPSNSNSNSSSNSIGSGIFSIFKGNK